MRPLGGLLSIFAIVLAISAVAAAGNNWIPASVFNIILNVVDGGMPAVVPGHAGNAEERRAHRTRRTAAARTVSGASTTVDCRSASAATCPGGAFAISV